MSAEELANTVAEVLQKFETSFEIAREQEHKRLAALQEALEQNTDTVNVRGGIRFPYFKGDESEDVNDFVKKFERAATFCGWSKEKQCLALPLYLQGDASIWLYNLSEEKKGVYDELKDALITQFDSSASHWRLRQNLDQRKQGVSEKLADYTADIRRQCHRLKLPKDEVLNVFVRGLRSPLRDFVILNSPADFETAQNLAKLKDSVSTPPTATVSALETKQIAESIVENLKTLLPGPSRSVAAFEHSRNLGTRPNDRNYQQDSTDDRQEIKRFIQKKKKQELRKIRPQSQQNFYPRPQNGNRGFRSTTGVPQCQSCFKFGHTTYSCRRMNHDRDPRIPRQNYQQNSYRQNRSQYNPNRNTYSQSREFSSQNQGN